MGRLHGLRVYLAGAIDRCPDGGAHWRQAITPQLEELGVVVLDPLDKPCHSGLEKDDSRAERKLWKEEGQWDRFAAVMKEIRRIDLRLVDISDILIVHLPIDIFACGTLEELFWANRLKRPIFVWCPQGVTSIPDWLWGTLPHEYFFSDIGDVVGTLRLIDEGNFEYDDGRWVFLDGNRLTPKVAVSTPA